ncbi:hypothetical protein D9M70_535600 [compost metagenome]
MVQVDVEDHHAGSICQEALRGDRRIVDEAEAAGDVGKGMMARWPAERIGRPFARHDRIGGINGAPGAPAHALPGFARDRTRGIGHVVAGLANGGRRVATVTR